MSAAAQAHTRPPVTLVLTTSIFAAGAVWLTFSEPAGAPIVWALFGAELAHVAVWRAEEREEMRRYRRFVTGRFVLMLGALAYAVGFVLIAVNLVVGVALLVVLAFYAFQHFLFWKWSRESERLWRERMASGYYKTLPRVEDDDE
jgi:hypothetical protein